MSANRQLNITLPAEIAEMVERKVRSGDFATESEVVVEGLKNLQARDAVFERWLVEQAAPAYDAYRANPSDVISLEDVFAELEAMLDDEAAA